MQAVYAIAAVAAAMVTAAFASRLAGGAWLTAFAYSGFIVFLVGFSYRVLRWSAAPVPFRIPTTCGQERSLPWIKSNRLDNPSTASGVIGRMCLEVLLFRSLFRNNVSRVRERRLIFTEQSYLWLAALAFHWSLLVIVIRHLRLLIEPVPSFLVKLGQVDSFFQIGTPPLYVSDLVFGCALAYLAWRRFRDPMVRYVSQFSDYFALLLIAGIAATGMLMRYATRVDVVSAKQFALGLAVLHPVRSPALAVMFVVHLSLVSLLAAYFPFSKLMHMGGVFLSPTRNLANNNRMKRHVNEWNHPVKTHTYSEWEQEFQGKLEAAEIPLEGVNVERVTAD
jgi:nitrate reductase gamma subunit